jgi:hypothetical protein
MILNLPEVMSTHEVLGVPNVSAFFGTAPDFWNLLLMGIVKVIPASLSLSLSLSLSREEIQVSFNKF